MCVQPFSTARFGVPSPLPNQGRRARQLRTTPEALRFESFAGQDPGHGGNIGTPLSEVKPGVTTMPGSKEDTEATSAKLLGTEYQSCSEAPTAKYACSAHSIFQSDGRLSAMDSTD